MRQQARWLPVDPVLIGAASALVLIGILLVWSATSHFADPSTYRFRHLFSIGVAVSVAALTMMLGHRQLRAWTPIGYGVVVVALLLVLIPGVASGGARRWIGLPGGWSLQPGEFAKLAVICAMAYLLAEAPGGRGRAMLGAILIAGIPTGLVLTQPDLGTALVIGAGGFGVLVLSGVRLRMLVGLVTGVSTLLAVGLLVGGVAEFQRDRITAFLDPTSDPSGIGYNARQAGLAIEAGGFSGTGLFAGPRTAGGFVPEQHTDFVFTVAGEELGFLGSATTILLCAVVLWRGIRIAGAAPDRFGRLVAGGVVCWLGFQVFTNIGMTLGLLPITGVPLPFVSYGGSSLLVAGIAVGLLSSISEPVRRREVPYG